MANRMTIGIDFGGSSSKATLLDENGTILATSTKEYPSYYPHPGWLEQDPQDFYDSFVYNVKTVLQKAGIDGRQITAIALDAATHMAVFADENDRPIRNIIHWSDNRCSAQVKWLKDHCTDLLKRYSCNAVSPAWTLPQMLWLNEHEPDVLKKTKRIYFAKDYVRHLITGDFYTDYIEAMGPMLADDQSETWSQELCDLVGVDVSMLPEIKAPSDIAGHVDTRVAEETGLSTDTLVIVGTTDTALEVYASGAVEVGCATVKLATAGRICPITTGAVDSPMFFNYKHIIPGLWYPGTTTRSCAASYKWYRDVLGTDEKRRATEQGKDPYELLNAAAEKVAPGSENLFFHPYLLGEFTPYYDDQLRASFTGVAMHHTKGHFTRAVMEGVAYSMKDCLEEIQRKNIQVSQFRIIGGGAKGKLWRQIVSDVLGQPLVCTQDNDSSLGSAMLAGVAVGMFRDYADSVAKCVRISSQCEPIMENVKVYEAGFHAYREIQKVLSGAYHKII